MASEFKVKVRDFGGETSTATFKGVTLTAANFDAQATLRSNLLSALEAITNGEIASTTVIAAKATVSDANPTDENAQRENKFVVNYSATEGGGKYRTELPAVILTGNLAAGTDSANLAATDVAAFVTAFEAYVKTPTGGSVTVNSIVHVGRDL